MTSALTRNDYDVWRCAKCGSEKRQPSVPHDAPVCCGTGMWWVRFYNGVPYQVPVESRE
jgi:hypothetical protein